MQKTRHTCKPGLERESSKNWGRLFERLRSYLYLTSSYGEIESASLRESFSVSVKGWFPQNFNHQRWFIEEMSKNCIRFLFRTGKHWVTRGIPSKAEECLLKNFPEDGGSSYKIITILSKFFHSSTRKHYIKTGVLSKDGRPVLENSPKSNDPSFQSIKPWNEESPTLNSRFGGRSMTFCNFVWSLWRLLKMVHFTVKNLGYQKNVFLKYWSR